MSEEKATFMSSSGSTFNSEIIEYIRNVYPEFAITDLLEGKEKIVKQSDTTYRELHEINQSNERYDLQWAFKKANESINGGHEEIEKKVKSIIPEAKEIFANTNRCAKQRIKKTKNIFTLLSFLISFTDIVVSVGLILLVTVLSQKIESVIESVLLNVLFIGLIAFAKVSLDRFVIIPRINKWGWQLYLKSIYLMKQISISLLSIGFVLEAAVKSKVDNGTLIELILRGIEQTPFTK